MINTNDKQCCYLDNAATTFISKEVIESMDPWIFSANANSHHKLGEKAHGIVEESRLKIATYLGVEPNEIFFTSGAAEANSWAISGFIGNDYSYCLTSKIEHHSILNNPDAGIPIDVTPDGKIDFDSFKFWPRVDYCSFMMVNNITGVRNHMKQVSDRLGKFSFLHCDCTQALGKIHLNLKENGIDMASFSSHKIHGPCGIGMLYVNKRAQRHLKPMIYGGSQEWGKRGGTTPTALIVGFANAVELAYEYMDENMAQIKRVHDYFVERLVASNLDYEFLVDPDKQLPSHLNVAFLGIRAEQLLSQLSEHNIYASSGSACDSDSQERNHVLKSMGIADELIDSSIRFSFSHDNTIEDIDYCMDVLETILPLMR